MQKPVRLLSWISWAFWLAVGFCPVAQAQSEDRKAQEYYNLGQKYFGTQNWAEAARYFDLSARRDPHRLTSASLYMTGLAFYRDGREERAIEEFQKLLKQYPESRFADAAQYHKALSMLKFPDKREGGLYLLLSLSELAKDPQIKQDAQTAVRKYLYEKADAEFLRVYYDKARPSIRETVLEALLYRLTKDGKRQDAVKILADYEKAGNVPTLRMRGAVGVAPVASAVPVRSLNATEEVRVAVVLPFQADRPDSLQDVQAQIAMEIFSGAQLAAVEGLYPNLRKVTLRAFDSAGDSVRASQLTATDLKAFKPHVVIGDVRNRVTRAIMHQLDTNQTVLVVPLADTDELVRGQGYTFLANPSELTSVRKLGEYARAKQPQKRYMVLMEETRQSEQMGEQFAQGLLSDSVEVYRRKVPIKREQAIPQINDAIRAMRQNKFDAVFMPIQNEELVSWALYKLNTDSVKVQIYGTDRWRAFRNIDKEMLFKYRVLLTDCYLAGNDSAALDDFTHLYLKRYSTVPSVYATQGYDITRMVLTALGTAPDAPTAREALRKAKPFRGISQNYYFAGAPSNQSVQILQYDNGEFRRQLPW